MADVTFRRAWVEGKQVCVELDATTQMVFRNPRPDGTPYDPQAVYAPNSPTDYQARIVGTICQRTIST